MSDRVPARPVMLNRRDREAGLARPDLLCLLTAEARRLGHRRCLVEAAAVRARAAGAGSAPLEARLARRSAHLRIAFHRALDRLWAADASDEALAIFRSYRADLAHRRARAARRHG